ncbi:hypothetical protein [Parasediminibacterium sp. JCM 36343]|uniref:hypothetical protein n=1 Tax=Parasediminibacterium sp. JCM 36343 TaxID=3374279 RepID=UPI00397BA91B
MKRKNEPQGLKIGAYDRIKTMAKPTKIEWLGGKVYELGVFTDPSDPTQKAFYGPISKDYDIHVLHVKNVPVPLFERALEIIYRTTYTLSIGAHPSLGYIAVSVGIKDTQFKGEAYDKLKAYYYKKLHELTFLHGENPITIN